MMELVLALAAIAVTANFVAGLGLLRFPDVYNRLHAATIATTFGTLFTAAAVALYCALYPSSPNFTIAVHTGVAVVAVLLTGPAASHAIGRAAYHGGVKPRLAVVDAYKGAQ